MPEGSVRREGMGYPEPARKTPGSVWLLCGQPRRRRGVSGPHLPAIPFDATLPASPRCPMAVPKRRQSNQKTRSRRAHDFLTPRQLTFCPTCGKAVPTHRVCETCGHYMGRPVVKTEE